MALQAELHREGFGLEAERHASHVAMTTRTADTLGNVNAVVEINVVRQVVHSVPDDRRVVDQAPTYRRKKLRVRPDLGMAGHAGIGWRQAGAGRHLHRGVTEPTINSQTGHMMLMAERHRLIDGPAEVTNIVG